MEKNLRKFRTIAIVLVVVLISLIAFVGIFGKSLNQFKNLIPSYTYGMDLEGSRELKFVVDTTEEEKNVYVDDNGNVLGVVKEDEENKGASLSTNENSKDNQNVQETDTDTSKPNYATETRTIKKNEDQDLTKDNFEKTKKIIQTRFNKQGISEYNIRLDSVTGELVIDVPDNEKVNVIYQLVQTKGTVQIIDHQTGIVLIDGSHIKKVESVYSSNSTEGYKTFLQVTFDKEGTEKLKEISNQYVEVTDEEGKSTKTYVEVTLDGEALLTTYFGEELSEGIIQIPMGEATKDKTEFKSVYETTQYLATIMDKGQTPVVYSLSSDNFIKSEITDTQKLVAKIAAAVVLAIVSVVLIVKYRVNGLLASISNIGFIALTILILRYTKVTITLNSVIAFVTMIILNMVFLVNLLKRLSKASISKAYNETMKNYYLSIIPFGVVAVIFTFMSNITIGSIGMIIFWCLFIQVIYNFIITKTMYIGKK